MMDEQRNKGDKMKQGREKKTPPWSHDSQPDIKQASTLNAAGFRGQTTYL